MRVAKIILTLVGVEQFGGEQFSLQLFGIANMAHGLFFFNRLLDFFWYSYIRPAPVILQLHFSK